MRVVRHLLFALCFLFSLSSFAQKEDWLPVSPQDLQYKEVPGSKGASAVRLYYANYLDDNAQTAFFYERIKILNDKGKDYGDVEIPFINALVNLDMLQARTIRPDGTIVEFTGKPFEKTIFKGRGLKVAAKAFSLPEVTVGSIVEYKYRLSFRNSRFFSTERWVLQDQLFTVKENFWFRPYEGGVSDLNQFYWPGARVSRVSSNLKDAKFKTIGNEVLLEMQNVPPFEPEGYMPPEDNYKPLVIFFYARKSIDSTEKAWAEAGKDQNEVLEKFLSGNRGVKEAADAAIGGETDPAAKLRKLYERAQKVRNLSYERTRTREEVKKENLKPNDNVSEVLNHDHGYDEQITAFFIAMARAAGFDASFAQVSDRRERFFNKEWTSLAQLDNLIAVVSLKGTDIYLEPGTKYCPFGLLRWSNTAATALKLDKKGGTFITVPPFTQDRAVTKRTADVSIAEDGSLRGEVNLEFKGEEALERRLDALDKDEAGRKKDLEDQMKDWLPTGAVVTLTTSQGWESSEDPLSAHFSIEVPAYGTLAGKRFILPSCLFLMKQKETFKSGDRKFPVYFPYPFSEMDRVTTQLPTGFTVESVPQQQEAKLGYARYQSSSQVQGLQLITERVLLFNGIFFPLEKYPELKGFFSKVQTGDEQQAVLHAGGTTSAQKTN
jgi:hypothetical protein